MQDEQQWYQSIHNTVVSAASDLKSITCATINLPFNVATTIVIDLAVLPLLWHKQSNMKLYNYYSVTIDCLKVTIVWTFQESEIATFCRHL